MKFVKEVTGEKMAIPAAALKLCGFENGDKAELHALPSAAIILKQKMTAKEENTMKNRMNKLAGKMNSMMICAHAALTDRRGEGYVDTAVKILMAVVIGALVLAGLYALFGDVVMPTLTERIQEMFDYAG